MRITVQNTATSTFDMKIGFMNDSIPYISLIRTACAPVCHSTIEFYDTAWNAIPIRFTMPKAIEWLDIKNIKSDSIDLDWIKNSLAVSFISLSFSDEDNVIVAKNNTLDFINEEDRKVIKPFLSEKILVYSLLDKTWTRRP
jgi:hypothetical protein